MHTPNVRRNTTLVLSCVVLALIGCGPETGAGWGEDPGFTGDGGSTDSGPDECRRRDLAEYACDGQLCLGRWDGTELWSKVWDIDEISKLPDVPSKGVWPCSDDLDVDACKKIDDFGHVGCFRFYGDYAVAVSPACAEAGWLDVGCEMLASPS